MYEDSLYHHGIKGQKWGVRRFQNANGSLTPAGKTRYSREELNEQRKEVLSKRKDALKRYEMIRDARGINKYDKTFNYLIAQNGSKYIYVTKEAASKYKKVIDPYLKTALSDVDAEYKSLDRQEMELRKALQ